LKRAGCGCALVALLLAGAAAMAAAWWIWRVAETPYQGYAGESVTVEVEPGTSATQILAQLATAGVVADARLARLWLVYVLRDPPLAAGEYRFAGPLTGRQVIAKLERGDVVTHPVTIVEGLTLAETAAALAASGLGDERRFRAAMTDPAPILDLDPKARDLEGYLFPSTYSFAKGTEETAIVATLVRTFRDTFAAAAQPLPAGRTVRDTVTLASLVEKEAKAAAERPLIAGVYARRLEIGMALQADPTVIFIRKRRGDWDGNLHRVDLEIDDPYNTYRYPGLPPGPIASPGVASLVAAATPAATRALYFVSRNDGTHAFAETLAQHNRNVQEWQKLYWRRR
jgi:UPF0755 protein